jgi:hypothetical protein
MISADYPSGGMEAQFPRGSSRPRTTFPAIGLPCGRDKALAVPTGSAGLSTDQLSVVRERINFKNDNPRSARFASSAGTGAEVRK